MSVLFNVNSWLFIVLSKLILSFKFSFSEKSDLSYKLLFIFDRFDLSQNCQLEDVLRLESVNSSSLNKSVMSMSDRLGSSKISLNASLSDSSSSASIVETPHMLTSVLVSELLARCCYMSVSS